jgi:cysteine desulfurase
MLYLDAAATTAVRREALEAAWPYLTGDFGNPSSTHEWGLRAASALADARARVAAVLGVRAGEVVFTSGGTEGDNLAIKGMALGAPRGRHLVTVGTEHEAVLESVDHLRRLHGFDVTFLPVDRYGRITPDVLTAALRDDTTLVSLAYANNEIGTVQPIAELAQVAHDRGALFHTDAVQATGRLSLDVSRLGVDALSLSGHKAGAPKGCGAVIVRGGVPLEPVISGGGQERGRRSGTENLAFAVALATALEAAEGERLAMGRPDVQSDGGLADPDRDRLIERVLTEVAGSELTGHPRQRIPGHASFVIEGAGGETVLLELERRGVIASSGSACAAGRDEPSHVLMALGIDESLARTALRLTWGAVAPSDLDRTTDALVEAVAAVRSLR